MFDKAPISPLYLQYTDNIDSTYVAFKINGFSCFQNAEMNGILPAISFINSSWSIYHMHESQN